MTTDDDGSSRQRIPSGPLFARLRAKAGAAAAFARALGISQQRLTNWKRRGVPSSELPRVAMALGTTVEAYLKETGREPAGFVRQPAVFLTPEEQQALDDFRRASPKWRLVLALLGGLPAAEQDEAADAVHAALADRRRGREPTALPLRETAFGSRHMTAAAEARKRRKSSP
jgi:hypothetical protein